MQQVAGHLGAEVGQHAVNGHARLDYQPGLKYPTERAAEAAPCGGAWANAVRARMVQSQPGPIAAEQGAVRIASPARPYRCQRSRSMTTAARTIARPIQKKRPECKSPSRCVWHNRGGALCTVQGSVSVSS